MGIFGEDAVAIFGEITSVHALTMIFTFCVDLVFCCWAFQRKTNCFGSKVEYLMCRLCFC